MKPPPGPMIWLDDTRRRPPVAGRRRPGERPGAAPTRGAVRRGRRPVLAAVALAAALAVAGAALLAPYADAAPADGGGLVTSAVPSAVRF